MSLTEIETAVGQLSIAEQEELLRHLHSKLGRRRNSPDQAAREEWMKRLDALRASIDTGKPSVSSSEEILTDLRGE
jgi:hypothetical protein